MKNTCNVLLQYTKYNRVEYGTHLQISFIVATSHMANWALHRHWQSAIIRITSIKPNITQNGLTISQTPFICIIMWAYAVRVITTQLLNSYNSTVTSRKWFDIRTSICISLNVQYFIKPIRTVRLQTDLCFPISPIRNRRPPPHGVQSKRRGCLCCAHPYNNSRAISLVACAFG